MTKLSNKLSLRIFITKGMWRIEYFLRDLRRGILLEFPLCCTLHFALGTAIRVPGQALRRGRVVEGDKKWVPCFYHKKHPNWEPISRPHI